MVRIVVRRWHDQNEKTIGAICSEAHRAAMEEISFRLARRSRAATTPTCARYWRRCRNSLSTSWSSTTPDSIQGILEPDLLAFPASQTGEHRTRLVFVPTESRVPGDRFMAQLVSVGVYDIADPTRTLEADIQSMVERPRRLRRCHGVVRHGRGRRGGGRRREARKAEKQGIPKRTVRAFRGRKKDREAQRDDTPAEQARKLETPPAAQPP